MSDAPVGAFMRSLMLDAIPAATIVAMILLTTLPMSFSPNLPVGGLWPLIGITFWTLSRPRSMHPVTVFCLGLFADIVAFVPFGIHAAVFVLAQYIIVRQRRFLIGQGFWVLWAAYALLATVVYAVLFYLTSLFLPGAIAFERGLIGVGIAWATVPLVAFFLSRLNDIIDLFDEPIA